MIQAYLGPTDKHNTYKAEIVGVILATWLLQNTPETLGKQISLYTDNQSIIDAITSQNATPGQYLINKLKSSANKIGHKLEIRWISSHSKVKEMKP